MCMPSSRLRFKAWLEAGPLLRMHTIDFDTSDQLEYHLGSLSMAWCKRHKHLDWRPSQGNLKPFHTRMALVP